MLIYFVVTVILGTTTSMSMSPNQTEAYNCGLVRPRGNSTFRKPILPFYLLGKDYDNIPVVLLPLGRHDLLSLVNPPIYLEAFTRNYDQWVEDIRSGILLKRFSNESWAMDAYAVIIDFAGLNIKLFLSEPAVKVALNNIIKIQRVAGYVSYGFIVNANPLAHQVLNVAKPSSLNLLERFEIHGTNSKRWIPQLLRRIPRSQLPPSLGGTRDFKPMQTCYFI